MSNINLPTLFDYQESLANRLVDNYEKGKNTIITLPTGTGKSRIIIEAIKKLTSKNDSRFVIIAPTRLLE
jgi:superfamily II DNA or RNA helicase